MNSKIYESKYKDQNCLVLESDILKIKVLPQCGSKIQSIYDKGKKIEYLYQTPGSKYILSKYDDIFAYGECSGFDEMFPSINECYYPSGILKGISVPDHGEVWSGSWSSEIADGNIKLAIHGERFPYQLEKHIEFLNEYTLRISYKLINFSQFEFKFIWAAHPLFNCSPKTKILLPSNVNRIVNVTEFSNVLGEYGAIHTWPVTVDNDGNNYDISMIKPKEAKKCEKFYVANKLETGRCALHDIELGDMVVFNFPVDTVPYLGFWVNEGGFRNQYCVAPEPCTGCYDSLDIADRSGKISVVNGKSEYTWYLDISIVQ